MFVSQYFLKQCFVCISNWVSGEKHKLVTSLFIRKCEVNSEVLLCYFMHLKLSDFFFKYLLRLYFNSVHFTDTEKTRKMFKKKWKKKQSSAV